MPGEIKMGIKLERADIVIVASAHNPRIVSPQWQKEKKLIVNDCRSLQNLCQRRPIFIEAYY